MELESKDTLALFLSFISEKPELVPVFEKKTTKNDVYENTTKLH